MVIKEFKECHAEGKCELINDWGSAMQKIVYVCVCVWFWTLAESWSGVTLPQQQHLVVRMWLCHQLVCLSEWLGFYLLDNSFDPRLLLSQPFFLSLTLTWPGNDISRIYWYLYLIFNFFVCTKLRRNLDAVLTFMGMRELRSQYRCYVIYCISDNKLFGQGLLSLVILECFNKYSWRSLVTCLKVVKLGGEIKAQVIRERCVVGVVWGLFGTYSWFVQLINGKCPQLIPILTLHVSGWCDGLGGKGYCVEVYSFCEVHGDKGGECAKIEDRLDQSLPYSITQLGYSSLFWQHHYFSSWHLIGDFPTPLWNALTSHSPFQFSWSTWQQGILLLVFYPGRGSSSWDTQILYQ